MKQLLIILLVAMIGTVCGQDDTAPITKGAVVEGHTIIKNKLVTVKEAIQSLKKELAECSQNGPVEKKDAHMQCDRYHARLMQLLYPTYIAELGSLAAVLERDSTTLQEAPCSQRTLEEIVDRAFMAADKVIHEKKLIAKIYEINRQEYELAVLKQRTEAYRNDDGRRAVSRLTADIARGKEEVASLKVRVAEINKTLYTKDLKQRVHLDRLKFRNK